jgi:hypothetical protein
MTHIRVECVTSDPTAARDGHLGRGRKVWPLLGRDEMQILTFKSDEYVVSIRAGSMIRRVVLVARRREGRSLGPRPRVHHRWVIIVDDKSSKTHPALVWLYARVRLCGSSGQCRNRSAGFDQLLGLSFS